MRALILLPVLLLPVLSSPSSDGEARVAPGAGAATQDPVADPKAEYEKRKKEAEGNVDKLWKLVEWCEAYGMKSEQRSSLRAILKLEPENRKAHEALGHIEYDGKWHDTEKKLEEYKKKKLEEEAKATGKAIYKGQLVDPADLPYLQKGMTKDASGKWVDLETQKKLAEGWILQDLTWVPPAEAPNIGKGLWKCGDKWLSLEEANAYHAEVSNWWVIPSERFVLYTTCPRAVAEKALAQCESAYRELLRAYGSTPAQAVPVVVLNSRDQYGLFARGEAGNPVPEALGRSSVHGAFMGEALGSFVSAGSSMPGVAYWDESSDTEKRFGPMYVRHAAGQSFAEALDPSTKAVAKLLKGETGNAYGESFWSEKQIPAWFRYGAAAYAERYLINSTVAAGGNPNETREWSVTNITNKGGLDPFDRIFKLEIGVDNSNSGKLINQAGLMVAFALDGKCADVTTKLGAFKDALKHNKDISKAAQALADEIKKNEAKLRAFAGL